MDIFASQEWSFADVERLLNEALSREQRLELASSLLKHSPQHSRVVTPASTFAAWFALVTAYEYARVVMHEEVINDMRIRDRIAAAIDDLSDVTARVVDDILAEVDGRYKAATLDDGGRFLAKFADIPDNAARWWWRRRPRDVSGIDAGAFE